MKNVMLIAGLLLCYSSWVNADCSLNQRTDLAKAGYGKSEIESMCKEQGDVSTQKTDASNFTGRSGIDLLSKASITGSNKEDREGRRCEFAEQGLLVKGKHVAFDQLMAMTQKDVNEKKQTIFFGVKVKPKKGGGIACNLMIVDNWRYSKDDNSHFLSDVEKFQAEYDVVVKDLIARNVEIKGASR